MSLKGQSLKCLLLSFTIMDIVLFTDFMAMCITCD